jgi:glycerate kinase
MVEKLEEGMAAFAEVIRTESGLDISSTPGTGAAGGLGGAFMAFLNARLTKGTDLIFDALDFDRKISGADLIITGEGRIDSQTWKGKAIDGVATRARKQGIPVIAIAGTVEKDDADHLIKESGFLAVLPIGKRPENESDLEYAMRPEVASIAIENTVAKAMESLFPSECLLTL